MTEQPGATAPNPSNSENGDARLGAPGDPGHDPALTGIEVPLPSVMKVLDQLGVGLALYDDKDRALAWNQAFLQMFPEHKGQIAQGEPYAENLRRFYRTRLSGAELENLERYVADGIERHRRQSSPFMFVHGGQWLRVASLPIPAIGRLRIWTPTPSPRDVASLARGMALGGQEPLRGAIEQIGDGAAARDPDGRIVAINHRFAELYGLEEPGEAIGLTFPDVLSHAWHSRERASDALQAWQDNSRFAEAPFEVPLPGDRWVRVREHIVLSGYTIGTHVDVTDLVRLQRCALESKYRAEALATTLRKEIDERSAFIDVLAHEVQQPLNDATSCLETLTDALHMRDARDDAALAGTRRMAQILDRIVLTLNNTLTAATTLNTMPDRPRQLANLGLLLEMVRLSLPDSDRDRLIVLLDTTRSTAVLDPVMVGLALNNLVRNALSHGEAGGKVVLTVSDDASHGICFFVRNKGRPGGPVLDHVLFERYPRPGKRPGASLGLWIVGQVARIHGGTAEGRIGPETTFALRLPMALDVPASPHNS